MATIQINKGSDVLHVDWAAERAGETELRTLLRHRWSEGRRARGACTWPGF